jgi:hypothetical protein
MRRIASWVGAGLACCAAATMASPAHAAKLTVTIANGDAVTMVAAIQRWDEDGNERKKINKDAKIDKPEADALAQKDDQRNWVFENLPEGRCDLVILAGTKRRIEGFDYPPVLEFDPFFPSNATVEEETRDFIVDHIKKSPHYENKVEPLYFGGDKKAVRVLVMLLRDKPTSYEADMPGAATIRHEIWQYSWQYGGWTKQRRTRVLDRSILTRDELRKWTWLWDPKLGGIEIKKTPVTLQYALPTAAADRKLKGLYPY